MEKIDFLAFWLSLQSETLTQLCLGRWDGVRWGVRSAHFKLVSNNMQLLIPNTALCCVFLFVVAPFHSLNPCKTPSVAAINELLSAPQCCCGLGEFADYSVHKGCVEGAWVLRHGKLLCLAETITAATSVLPSFSRDWPASFVLRALSLSFSLVLHPVMSSCIYLLLVIVSNKDTPRL